MRNLSCMLFSFVMISTIFFVAGAAEEGFETIFNGKNLDGWTIQGLEKSGPNIQDDGVLAVDGFNYWALITKKDYQNFILRFDFKVEKKGNSGILIHTPKKEVYKSSFEIQVSDDTNEEAIKSVGAIYGLVAPAKKAAKAVGEWNSMEIKMQDNKISVIVNGERVQDNVDLTSIDGLKHKFEKGGIAIQRDDWKKAVYFKNIRVKEL
jgi:hypothetical protein